MLPHQRNENEKMDASFEPSSNKNGGIEFEFEEAGFHQGARSDGFKTWNNNGRANGASVSNQKKN